MTAEQTMPKRPPERLARSLGWASIGLGIPQLLRPDAVTRVTGVGAGTRQRAVTTAVGARELLHAAALLGSRTPSRWVWTRVAGDAVDLTALVRSLRRHDGRGLARTVGATTAVAAITAVDVYTAVLGSRRRERKPGMELSGHTTVRKDPRAVYEYWRRLENLPAFMAHVDDVTTDGGGRSHWTVSAPFGRSVEWDAEIVEDVPGERLSWRSVTAADISNEGTVIFTAAPGDQGTEISVVIRYDVPGGRLGEALARFAGEDPRQQVDDDLRRVKQVLETGEIVRSDGAPWGKRARKEFPQRPAQPLSAEDFHELAADPTFTSAAGAAHAGVTR
jgi:uncharacterized membrane protein